MSWSYDWQLEDLWLKLVANINLSFTDNLSIKRPLFIGWLICLSCVIREKDEATNHQIFLVLSRNSIIMSKKFHSWSPSEKKTAISSAEKQLQSQKEIIFHEKNFHCERWKKKFSFLFLNRLNLWMFSLLFLFFYLNHVLFCFISKWREEIAEHKKN